MIKNAQLPMDRFTLNLLFVLAGLLLILPITLFLTVPTVSISWLPSFAVLLATSGAAGMYSRYAHMSVWRGFMCLAASAWPTFLSILPYFRSGGREIMTIIIVLSTIAMWLISIACAAVIGGLLYRIHTRNLRKERQL